MRLDDVDAEVQLFGDLLVRQAAARQLGDALLAGSKAATGRRAAAADPVQLREPSDNLRTRNCGEGTPSTDPRHPVGSDECTLSVSVVP